MKVSVKGLGLEFRVSDSGSQSSGVQDSCVRVQVWGFRDQALGFRVLSVQV